MAGTRAIADALDAQTPAADRARAWPGPGDRASRRRKRSASRGSWLWGGGEAWFSWSTTLRSSVSTTRAHFSACQASCSGNLLPGSSYKPEQADGKNL